MKNTWEIIDDEGVIYSGSQEEMEEIFSDWPDDIETAGDTKLVEVHGVFK